MANWHYTSYGTKTGSGTDSAWGPGQAGALIVCSGIPAWLSQMSGGIVRYYHLGRVEWGEGENISRHYTLHYASTLITDLDPGSGRLKWTLQPGISALFYYASYY